MKQPAILYFLWPKNIFVLDHYLKLYPQHTLITTSVSYTSEFAEITERYGCNVIFLDQLVTADVLIELKQILLYKLQSILASFETNEWESFCRKHGLSVSEGMSLVTQNLSDRLLEEMITLQALEIVKSNFLIEILVTSEDVTRISRIITEWAKVNAVPSLQLMHGVGLITPYSVHKRVHTDYIAIYGEKIAPLMQSVGIAAERIVATGNPAWDIYPSIIQNRSALRSQIIEKHHLDPALPIIVFGTTWSAKLSAFSDQDTYEKSLRYFFQTLKFLEKKHQFNIIIKDRPSNAEKGPHFAHEAAINAEVNLTNVHYTTDDTEILVCTCDLLISLDSSLSAEAIVCGTPAINLTVPFSIITGPTIDAYDDIPEVLIDDNEKLANTIETLLFDKTVINIIKDRFRQIAPLYNAALNGEAAANVARLMSQMVQHSKPKTDNYPWKLLNAVDENPIADEYHTTPRMELINMFRHNPKVYLEIGCGAGATIKTLKEHFPDMFAIGIELNKQAANVAGKYADLIIDKPFEEVDFNAFGIAPGSIDTVILADVLEHMYNPWGTLSALHPYLAANAQVLASIPNVRNLWLINELIQGNWTYQKEGLLDVTHIRFFTKKECIKLFEETGYTIDTISANLDGRINITGEGDTFSVSADNWNMTLSKDDALEMSILQFLIRATPNTKETASAPHSDARSAQQGTNTPPIPSSMETIALIHHPFNTLDERSIITAALEPINAIGGHKLESVWKEEETGFSVNTSLLAECRAVIVFNEGAFFKEIIVLAKQLGKTVIVLLNSNLLNMPRTHSQYYYYEALKHYLLDTIEQADVLAGSMPELVDQLQSSASAKLLPSMPDTLLRTFEPYHDSETDNGKITIAWLTEAENVSNLGAVSAALVKIQEKYRNILVRIYVINAKADIENPWGWDIRYVTNVTYEFLINYIAQQHDDIAIMPLIKDTYRFSLPPEELFLWNALEVPIIASKFPPYTQFIAEGKTGFLCTENIDEWISALCVMIDSKSIRQQIAAEAKSSLTAYYNESIHLWKEFFATLPPSNPISYEIPAQSIWTRERIAITERYPYWKTIEEKRLSQPYVWENELTRWTKMPSFGIIILCSSNEELSMLADTVESLARQYYSGWEALVIAPFSAPEIFAQIDAPIHWVHDHSGLPFEQINLILPEWEIDWACVLRAGDQLTVHATAYATLVVNQNNDQITLIYSDHDAIIDADQTNPSFKPDFNLDMLRSFNYIDRACFFSKSAWMRSERLNPLLHEAQLYDMVLKILDVSEEQEIVHADEILMHLIADTDETNALLRDKAEKIALKHHLFRNNIAADVVEGLVPNTHRVLYFHDRLPLVSILVPNKNMVQYLKPCIDTLFEKTTYENFEVIVADNGSVQKELHDYYAAAQAAYGSRFRVIAYDKPFNYSEANNIAAEHANGEYLFLLNNDTEILHPNWLDVMMSHAMRPEVGIVGARLLYPNGKIQHAGVIVGLSGKTADHIFALANPNEENSLKRLHIDQNYSAVTAAALLIRRSIYDEVQGLNAIDYTVNFSDVDLCLKVVKAGHKIVWTPHATLLHHGSMTQKEKVDSEEVIQQKNKIFFRDRNSFAAIWKEKIIHDPNFNIHLDRMEAKTKIDLIETPHWNRLVTASPRIWGFPRGIDGGGEYRVMSPLRTLEKEKKAQTHIAWNHISASALMRHQPGSILYQTPLHDWQMAYLQELSSLDAPLIFEIDDLLTNIPINNAAFHRQYKDIHHRLAKSVKLCNRLVVSTEPLANAFKKLHRDIVILPNYLPMDRWGHLSSQRNTAEKPRVGWAGGAFHHGDLMIISEAVKELANEVEWVFFGLCPAEFLPYIHEYHPPVSLEEYPAKLASLNLDLALAPLEINPFNEAKSNLRLLEYGIMGWPIIATDIYPYQGDAPITRVKNRPIAWTKAIREKLSDPVALSMEGNSMREWVLRRWMLENNLDEVLSAYLF